MSPATVVHAHFVEGKLRHRGACPGPRNRATVSYQPDALTCPSASFPRFIFPTTRLGAESQFSDFLDGLGPAQIVGRQTLATPPMGESSGGQGKWGNGSQAADRICPMRALCDPSSRNEPWLRLRCQREVVSIALVNTPLLEKEAILQQIF